MKVSKLAALAVALSAVMAAPAYAEGDQNCPAGQTLQKDPTNPQGPPVCLPGGNVPEPGSWALVGLGLAAAVAAARAARR